MVQLEDSLNGGFKGLYGEVVTCDCYRIRELDFIPDVVIDLGANVGVFTRFCRELWKDCKIISIEPDKSNFEVLSYYTKDDNIILINKAIGEGDIYRGLTAVNGGGATYLNTGLGFPDFEGNSTMEKYKIDTVMLPEIVEKYVKEGDKLLIKIDIEGNEHKILMDEESMKCLKRADYICMEVHFYALTGNLVKEVRDKTTEMLMSLDKTHKVELDNVHYWAKKL